MKKFLSVLLVFAIMLSVTSMLGVANAEEKTWPYVYVNEEAFNTVINERGGNVVHYNDYLSILFKNAKEGKTISASLFYDNNSDEYPDLSKMVYSKEEKVLQSENEKSIVFPTFDEVQKTVELTEGIYWLVCYENGNEIGGYLPVFLTKSNSFFTVSINSREVSKADANEKVLPVTVSGKTDIKVASSISIGVFKLNKMIAIADGNERYEGFTVLHGDKEKTIKDETFSSDSFLLEYSLADLEDGLYAIEVGIGPFLHTVGFKVDSTPQPVYTGFPDVPANHWAYNYIKELTEKGVLNGYEDGSFRPSGLVTRNEFAKIMVLALGIPLQNPSLSSFADINPGAWELPYVEAAKDYIDGYQDGSSYHFRGNTQAVREDMAVALVKALMLEDEIEDEEKLASIFSDWESISPNLRKYVLIAYNNMLIEGYPDGSFGPLRSITRAETAALLVKVLKQVPPATQSAVPEFSSR